MLSVSSVLQIIFHIIPFFLSPTVNTHTHTHPNTQFPCNFPHHLHYIHHHDFPFIHSSSVRVWDREKKTRQSLYFYFCHSQGACIFSSKHEIVCYVGLCSTPLKKQTKKKTICCCGWKHFLLLLCTFLNSWVKNHKTYFCLCGRNQLYVFLIKPNKVFWILNL